MNYIYDIFLNYNKIPYEIFEWNKEDKIIHVRKIPFLLLETNDLYNLINKKVKISMDFLSKIYNKTEIFPRKNKQTLEYCFLATDKSEVMAFLLNKNGNIKAYSKLLLEEEIEIIEYSKSLKYTKLEYKNLIDNKYEHFTTRNENNIRKFIYSKLDNMVRENEQYKINFLCLEIFNRNLKVKNPIKKIYDELEFNWENIYIKVYNFLKMIDIKR